ncbi:AMP-binding protein [Miniimonas arenae]|uniref:AMP-binding protein n=1 Tax=Miniimonas arenae TaxID=676201 RepID=A0A5C5BFK8_9MICO|nr:AMP-binding protein [Miniimonas arenae]TNU76752.1 AMP-binding protein [Miniimonas arenae]
MPSFSAPGSAHRADGLSDGELTAALDGDRPLVLGDAEVAAPGTGARGLARALGAAALVPTSGSTSGVPRVVALTTANLRASANATHERLGGAGAWLLTVPDTHVAGLMVRVRAHLAGTPVVHADGPFRPEGLVAGVRRLAAVAPGGRRYVSLVPTQLRRVLADPAATEALATFDTVLVGGAATPPPLLDAAHAAGVRAVTTYGMTETAGGCVYDGEPLRDVDVRLGADQRVLIDAPQVALGYVAGGVLEPFDGTFATADRGLLADGRLCVLGRLDDVLVSGGVNVDPAQVEAVVAGLDGVAEVAVVGVPDPEWGQAVVAVVVPTTPTPGDRRDLAEAVRAVVRSSLPPGWVPRRVLVRDSLPLRGPGKIDRRGLAAELADPA